MNTSRNNLYAFTKQDAETQPEDSTRSLNEYRGNSCVLLDGEIPQEWLRDLYIGLCVIAGVVCIAASVVGWCDK